MCLAKAFEKNWNGQPVFEDIARLRISGGRVEMENLFGEGKSVPGQVIEIDFTASRILLGQPGAGDNGG